MHRYIKYNPEVDRIHIVQLFSMVRSRNFTDEFIQGVGAARGLEYLHSLNVIYGDLKGVRLSYTDLFTILCPPFLVHSVKAA